MEKRFIIFIALSFLVMAGWQLIISRYYSEPPPATPATEASKQPSQQPQAESQSSVGQSGQSNLTGTPQATQTNAASPTTAGPTNEAAASALNIPPRSITVDTPLWRGVFDNQGGVVKSLNIKQLPNGRELLSGTYSTLELISPEGLQKVGAPLRLEVSQNPDLTKKLNGSNYAVEASDDTIKLSKGEQKDLVFTYKDATGLSVQKRLRFYGGQYLFDVAVDASLNGQPLQASMLIGPNFGDQSVKEVDTYVNTPQQTILEHGKGKVTFLTGNELQHRNAPPDRERDFSDDVSWVAAADHYFAMAVVPPTHLPKATIRNDFFKENVAGKEVYKNLLSIEFPLVNNQPYQVFVGPKDRDVLQDANKLIGGRADLEGMINYGMFSFMVKPIVPVLELLLKLFYKLIHNYGWAIIVMTFIINMFFFPLKWKSSVAMKKAVKLQPKMKEIQEKMKKLKKDDPRMQQLQLEQMKLMKEGNPLSGCLPMLLQMPIFWAFYIYLSISIDVRHSPFIFWIRDLAGPDTTWVLPIIMTISMMASTALTPTPSDPSQKMQKFMTSYIMPVVFLLLFFSKAPSGLVLYWMFGSIISVGQQLIINKMTAEPAGPTLPADTGKTKADKTSTDDKNRAQTGDLANVR